MSAQHDARRAKKLTFLNRFFKGELGRLSFRSFASSASFGLAALVVAPRRRVAMTQRHRKKKDFFFLFFFLSRFVAALRGAVARGCGSVQREAVMQAVRWRSGRCERLGERCSRREKMLFFSF